MTNNKSILNKVICIDDFGNEVYRCHYTAKIVTIPSFVFVGTFVRSPFKYVCHPDSKETIKADRAAFDESEANCNTCKNFCRVKHDKNKYGFVKGECPSQYKTEYWIHPDDPMHMNCWESRIKE